MIYLKQNLKKNLNLGFQKNCKQTKTTDFDLDNLVDLIKIILNKNKKFNWIDHHKLLKSRL